MSHSVIRESIATTTPPFGLGLPRPASLMLTVIDQALPALVALHFGAALVYLLGLS